MWVLRKTSPTEFLLLTRQQNEKPPWGAEQVHVEYLGEFQWLRLGSSGGNHPPSNSHGGVGKGFCSYNLTPQTLHLYKMCHPTPGPRLQNGQIRFQAPSSNRVLGPTKVSNNHFVATTSGNGRKWSIMMAFYKMIKSTLLENSCNSRATKCWIQHPMALQNGHTKCICSGLKSKENVAAIGRGMGNQRCWKDDVGMEHVFLVTKKGGIERVDTQFNITRFQTSNRSPFWSLQLI